MTYEQYKEQREAIYKAHDIAGEELINTFPMTSAYGHTQATLDNPDFKRLYKAERVAFKALQDFNVRAPKEFSKRLRKETRGY